METANSYQSRDGFLQLPILRGLGEIGIILSLVNENDGIILGGYARYCISPNRKPKPPNDVDVYCQNKSGFEAIRKGLFEIGFIEEHENQVAITFTAKRNADARVLACPDPQLIRPENKGAIVGTGTMEEILSNFDFTVVRAGIGKSTTHALADADFEHDESHHLLRIKNIHCPVSSLLRCMKYGRKGYFLRPFEALKLFRDWDERDDEYRARLVQLFDQSMLGDLSQVEIDELEALLRID